MYFFAKKIAALKSKIALNHGGVIFVILFKERFKKTGVRNLLKSNIIMPPTIVRVFYYL